MNFRHLSIFLSVCETGSMTRAARQLYLAQPTVSQVISDLEKYYGARLFERLNQRLYLTPAGERLRSYARHILNLSEQAQKELADLSRAGLVRLGASLTVGAYLLPGLVSAFRQQQPQVEVFTRVDNTGVIESLLVEDQLDFGLVEGPVHSPHIVEEYFQDDDLVFIASPLHPLARPGVRRVQELAGQGFLVREAGSGTQEIFEHALHAAGIRWKTAGICNNNEALKQAVSANLGLGMVSRLSIAEEVRQGRLVPLEVAGLALRRKFNLVYHRQKFFTPAMQLFREGARSMAPRT